MNPLVPAGSSPAFSNCAATYSAARLWPGLPVLRPSIESSARTLTYDHQRSASARATAAEEQRRMMASMRRMSSDPPIGAILRRAREGSASLQASEGKVARALRATALELFDRIPAVLEHGEQAVRSDEVRGTDDDEGMARPREQLFELRHPRAVPRDEQPLVHDRILFQIGEHDPLDRRRIAALPRVGELADVAHLGVDALERV